MMLRSLHYLRQLSSRERSVRANRHLGYWLAWIAGAANAGGFLVVAEYTSHMTGIVSALADHLALGQFLLAAAGLISVASFMAGAAACAWLVHWARRHALHSEYALPLLLEAGLMLMFGLLGHSIQLHSAFYVPYTVLLLCFMMGLQNAIITKISQAEIRTTHVTGLVTDVGIGLGRWLFWKQYGVEEGVARENRLRLFLHAALVVLFLLGGVLGALGFSRLGFSFSVVLALLLLLLAIMPLHDDWRRYAAPGGRGPGRIS